METVLITLRLPMETYLTLKRRCNAIIAMPPTLSRYIADRLIYDTTRKHRRTKKTLKYCPVCLWEKITSIGRNKCPRCNAGLRTIRE